MTSPADGASTNATGGADTYEAAIAAALAGLDDLSECPVSEHVERFEAAHAALTDALSGAESLLSGAREDGS